MPDRVYHYLVEQGDRVLAKCPTRTAAVEYARRYLARMADIDVSGEAPAWVVRPRPLALLVHLEIREVSHAR